MKRAFVTLLVALSPRMAMAAPIVVTFETPPLGTQIGPLVGEYGGIDWGTYSWLRFSPQNMPMSPHSGMYGVYLTVADPPMFSFVDGPKVFAGAWFTGYANTTGVTFLLYDLEGTLVHTSETLAVSPSATYLASGYAGFVSSVVVWPSVPAYRQYWLMDDVTYDDGVDTAAVPEPASLLLLGTGLAGLVRVARQRTQ